MIVPHGVSRVYSEQPFIAEYRQFLSKKQCQKIVSQVPNLTFTQGSLRFEGKRQVNLNQRNAFTHVICEQDPDVVRKLPEAIVSWLQLPTTKWLESSLLIHYPPGGEFKLHTDVVENTDINGQITNRVATLIVYLNDNYEGGHTVFPYKQITVKPAVGKALLFQYNYNEPTLNHMTMHLGQKVDADKFILVFFIRDREFPDQLRALTMY